MIGPSGCLGSSGIIQQHNSRDFYPASPDILSNRKNKRHISKDDERKHDDDTA
jgi:hypothetical protein